LDANTSAQLRIIGELRAILDSAGIAWWLFGGWAMDFHAGAVTRDHADIELFVWARDREAVRERLAGAGFAAPQGLHPEEGQPYLKDGQEIGTWYLQRDADRRVHVSGRFADWRWPEEWFDGPRGSIGELDAPVMSVEGLLEMKTGFASHPHGAPRRPKDDEDIARLRAMLG
jgi:hypothetical protein